MAALREYVERKYELFRREEGLPTLHYFYVIGSERPFDEGCQALARPTVVLCHPLANGLWDFRLPRGDIDMPTADFLLHILPGMRDAYADAMATEIDRWDQTSFITQDALRERLRLDSSTYHGFLSRWLDTLFVRGGYGRGGYRDDDAPREGGYGRGGSSRGGYGRFWLNAVCVLCIVEIIFFSALWLCGSISGLWSQLAWVLPAVAGLGCQWSIWHTRNRSVR